MFNYKIMKKLVKPIFDELKEEKFEALVECICGNISKACDNIVRETAGDDDQDDDQILF
jgi:hypothetical protein